MQVIPESLLEGWKIVVIDDEADSLEVANIILLEYGADVYTAANGKQGYRLVRAVRPEFVISDLSMPEMDGWGFIAEMQKNRELSEIPVIALTAHGESGDRKRAINAGFVNYLTKPLTVDTFISDLLLLLEDTPALANKLNTLDR
ncbi:MAG: response regulator [Aggregatilineales bacterium]